MLLVPRPQPRQPSPAPAQPLLPSHPSKRSLSHSLEHGTGALRQ